VNYIWVIEVRAPKSLSQNFWQPYSFNKSRSGARAAAAEFRVSQHWCLWRVRQYFAKGVRDE
jgi:hypothetical protein